MQLSKEFLALLNNERMIGEPDIVGVCAICYAMVPEFLMGRHKLAAHRDVVEEKG
jgi:hypothetical protein